MSDVPIAAHDLLSNCHGAALVTAAGSVDWLCWARFDSPSVFGRLLDDAAAHWSIRPAGEYSTSRRYVDRTLVLETTFRTPGGTVVLTDALAINERGRSFGPSWETLTTIALASWPPSGALRLNAMLPK